MSEDDSIERLALDFAKKNPDLLRDIMTSFNLKISPPVEFSQGKMTKCGEINKQYKI